MYYALISSAIAVLIITIVALFHLELKGKSTKARIILLCVLIVEFIAAAWFYGGILVFNYQFAQAFAAPVPQGEVLQMGRADAEVVNNIKQYLYEDKDKKVLVNILNQFQLRTQGEFFITKNVVFPRYNAKEHAQQYNKLAAEIQAQNK